MDRISKTIANDDDNILKLRERGFTLSWAILTVNGRHWKL